MIALLAVTLGAWAACPPGGTSGGDIVRASQEAELAFADLNDARFRAARAQTWETVHCARALVTPVEAGAAHRVEAMMAFMARDEMNTIRAFQGALAAQPNFVLPAAIAPAGGPMDQLYQAARNQAPSTILELPIIPDATYVNGRQGRTFEQGVPTVVQVVRADGALAWTAIIRDLSTLPPWFVPTAPRPPGPAPQPIGSVPMPEPDVVLPIDPIGDADVRTDLDREPRGGAASARTGMSIGAVVMGVIAGGLYGGAAVTRSQYDQVPTAAGRKTTNGLYFGAVGSGAVAIGLGAAAVGMPSGGPYR